MLQINTLDKLHLGIRGENKATTIRIDMSAWAEEYPDAVFNVIFQPHDSELVYPMFTSYDSETKVLSWVISNAVTAEPGECKTEIRAQDSETSLVKKSRIIPSFVAPSVTGTETEPPEPQAEWVTEVLNAAEDAVEAAEAAETAQGKAEDAQEAAETAQGKAEDAQEAAEDAQSAAENAQEAAETAQGKAEEAVAHYPYIDDNSGNWMNWEADDEQFEDTGVHAQGEQGIQAFLYIRYAASQPTQDSDIKTTPDAWIGVHSGTETTAPAHYTDYDWYRMKGEDGDEAYIHIRYAASQPTQDSDMKTTPDAWIGVYGGTSSTAPVHYTDYDWYKIKGETGPQGVGLPTGGNAGDVLVKHSGTDFDYEWSDEVLHPVVNVSHTIPANGWTAGADGYTYTWLNSNVTATSDVEVEFLDGAEDADGDILSYEKVTGGIEFTCETMPATGIPVAITIYRAKNESITDIDGSMVSTDVISGTENVDEALEALDEHIANLIHKVESSGNITTSTSLTYTGKFVSIPAKSYFFLRGFGDFSNAACNGIVLSLDNNPAAEYSFVGSYLSGLVNSVSFCGYTNNAITIYLHAKYQNASINKVGIIGGYITE